MTTQADELLSLEKQFWSGGPDFYKAHADAECLVAFTGMAGLMSNADLADTAKNPKRWRDVELTLKGAVEPGKDITILTYEAKATRENGDPYKALVSSGYVHRAEGWRMMFHAQTPLEDAPQKAG